MNDLTPFGMEGDASDGIADADVYLRRGDAIELFGKLLVVESASRNPPGYIFSDPEAPGDEQKITNRVIKDWWTKGKLSFVSKDEFGLPIGVQQSLRRTLRGFDAVERKEIIRRLPYVRAFDDLGKGFAHSDETLTPVCEAVAARRRDDGPHSWSTVLEWWTRWARSGRDPRALNPSIRRRGNRTDRLPDYMMIGIEKGRKEWLRLGQPKMMTGYKAVVSHCKEHHGGQEAVERLLEADPDAHLWPSYKTFTVHLHRTSRTRRLANRNGARAARVEMYPVGEGPEAPFALHSVEADFKYLRLMVVDDRTGLPLGTPYLMVMVDRFCGAVVGFDLGFDPPSYLSVARCLKHAISYKDLSSLPVDEDGRPLVRHAYEINGVPRTIVLDNDAAFHSRALEMSAQALGCNINYVPPGAPWDKGKIERLWLTVQDSYMDVHPGKVLRIGESAFEYDPEKDAVITLSSLNLFVTKAFVDVHHQADEPGTDTPRIELWRQSVAVHRPRPVRSHDALVELVGAYVERKAERRGIALFGLRYNSDELALYRDGFQQDPRVAVRYDPQDISRVWVVDRTTGTSFAVPCTRPDYADGLSEHQHRVIRYHAGGMTPVGRRLKMKTLLLAKVELFELGQQMIGKKRSRRAGNRIAHFLGIGRKAIDDMNRSIEAPSADGNLDVRDPDADGGLSEDLDDDADPQRDDEGEHATPQPRTRSARAATDEEVHDDHDDQGDDDLGPATSSAAPPDRGTGPIEFAPERREPPTIDGEASPDDRIPAPTPRRQRDRTLRIDNA